MSHLIASTLALRTLPALVQRPDGLRTAELAAILGIPFSSADRALDVLQGDRLARRVGMRTVLADEPRADAAVRFALAMLPPDEAVASIAGANPAVEFAGWDADGFVVVTRRFAQAADEARLAAALDVFRAVQPDVVLQVVAKSDLRERLREDLSPRRRATRMRVMAGSIDRSFPDRTRHGDESARQLGRLHEAIALPSARRLRALARGHDLRRLVAFGSATRADFRPDSDLDLLVEPAGRRRFGLRERAAFVADAETLFGRDVDVVAADEVRPPLADVIARTGVVLLGPAA